MIVRDSWGALHKIGRFRNAPTVGTFRKRPILCNAPLQCHRHCDARRGHEENELRSLEGSIGWRLKNPLAVQCGRSLLGEAV